MLITDKEKLKMFHSCYRVWQGIPAIERTGKGRLFCTFYTGSISETYGNYCPLLISEDDGLTWTEPVCVAYAGEGARCYDPVLWIDPMKRLWFIWDKAPDLGVYASICEDPDAEELSWSEVFYIGNDNMICKPTILSTGEWLFPVAVWEYNILCDHQEAVGADFDKYSLENIEKNLKETGANVYVSNDNGKTFSRRGGNRNIAARNYDEHMIYERKDGVLVMHTRTNYGVSKSLSYDRGVTWTMGKNCNIAGPCSRFHIRRLASGRLLLVNHYNFTGRNNLTALLSEDDGETWPYKLLLDERDNVSYPDMTESKDGYLYIIYDRERGSHQTTLENAQKYAREILMAKITEEDIMQGRIVSEGSRLKCIINKLGEYMGTKDYYGTSPLDPENLLKDCEDVEDCLKKIFYYYPMNCQNSHCINMEKKEKLICQIRNGEGDTEKHFNELICLLNEAARKAGEIAPVPLMDRILSYLQTNFKEHIELSALAAELDINLYYMCHIFKQRTGLSILEYRNSLRFSHAMKLLVNSEMSVTEICQECGFSDASYFISKFKDKEKMTPLEYRKLHQF